MTKITVFVGSLREKSLNLGLARAIEGVMPGGFEFVYADINLPLFNEDLERSYPEKAQALKDLIESSDGVLFALPEYNRSVPGVLKNAIDWASRPFGANSFKGKPVGVVGASLNIAGTAAAQAHFRGIAAFLEMKQLGQPEVYIPVTEGVFNDEGELVDERWLKNVRAYASEFAGWVDEQK